MMRLLIAREALDPRLKITARFLMRSCRSASARRPFLVAENFMPDGMRASGCPNVRGRDRQFARDLRGHVNYAARTSKRLARGLFNAMARFGPKLDREQLLLSRFVGIATELFAISATCSYAQWLLGEGKPGDEILSVADYFCRSARMRIDHHFAGRDAMWTT